MGGPIIGVAISTHRRPDVLAKALQHWAKAMPDVLVVNHDVNGDGVAATKNRGIANLMDAGCDHLFLCDDDVWPLVDDPFTPYVEDREPHLMHVWGRHRYAHNDGPHTVWRVPCGVMLYVERRVIDKVGGMRTEYGRWGGEHAEWSRRIHHVGLTTHRYADLKIARNGYWHALDRINKVTSSVKPEVKTAYKQRYHELRERFRNTSDYVEYRA